MDKEFGGGVTEIGDEVIQREDAGKAVRKIPEVKETDKKTIATDTHSFTDLSDNVAQSRDVTDGQSNEFGLSGWDEEFVEESLVKTEHSSEVSGSLNVTDELMYKLKNNVGLKPNNISHSKEGNDMSLPRQPSAKERDDKRQLKRLPKHLTSSVASSSSRYPSEMDSMECMIDDIVRESAPQSNSASTSGVYWKENITPGTPLDQGLFARKQENYKLAFMSDAHLDYDDVFIDNSDKQSPDRAGLGKLSQKKKGLVTMGSLDRLLSDQGDINETDTELEKEYQDALRYSTEDDPELVELFAIQEKNSKETTSKCEKQGKNSKETSSEFEKQGKNSKETTSRFEKHGKNSKETTSEFEKRERNSKEKQEQNKPENSENNPPKVDEKYEKQEPIIFKASATSNEALVVKQVEKIDVLDGKIVKSEHYRKPKLEAMSSLDVLIDEQGSNIDETDDFDKDLLESLEQQFNEHIAQEQQDIFLKNEYAFLGIKHQTKDFVNTEPGKNNPTEDNGFEQLVNSAETFLASGHGKTSSYNKVITQSGGGMLRRSLSTSSEDSDVLSVIEEVEDEYDAPNAGITKDGEITSESQPLQNTYPLKTVPEETNDELLVNEATTVKVVEEAKTSVKDKIFNLFRNLGSKEPESVPVKETPNVEDKDEWQTIESIESNIVIVNPNYIENCETVVNEKEIVNVGEQEKVLEFDQNANSEATDNKSLAFGQDESINVNQTETLFNSTMNTPSRENVLKAVDKFADQSVIEDSNLYGPDAEAFRKPIDNTLNREVERISDVFEDANNKPDSHMDSFPVCDSSTSEYEMSPETQMKFQHGSYFCGSINDSRHLCNSIDSELDTDQSGEQLDIDYIIQANSSRQRQPKPDLMPTADYEHNANDRENKLETNATDNPEEDGLFKLSEKTVNKNLMLKIDVLRDSCKTVSSMSEADDIEDEQEFNVPENNTNKGEMNMAKPTCESLLDALIVGSTIGEQSKVCQSIDEDLDKIHESSCNFVFKPINEHSEDWKEQNPECFEHIETTSAIVNLKRKESFTTEIQMVLDDQGKLTPPSDSGVQFFKEPPVRPPRTKKVTSLLASSKPPTASNSAPSGNPFIKMDSSDSGI